MGGAPACTVPCSIPDPVHPVGLFKDRKGKGREVERSNEDRGVEGSRRSPNLTSDQHNLRTTRHSKSLTDEESHLDATPVVLQKGELLSIMKSSPRH